MEINLHNYEALLLDFIEGRLDPVVSNELMLFIGKHPELGSWQELSAELPAFLAETHPFPNKKNLRYESMQAAQDNRINELYFKVVEETANQVEREQLDVWLAQRPEKQKEYKYWKHSRLKANFDIVFPDKSSLLKSRAGILPLWVKPMAAAASFALLFGLGWLFFNQKPNVQPGNQLLVENQDNVVKTLDEPGGKTANSVTENKKPYVAAAEPETAEKSFETTQPGLTEHEILRLLPALTARTTLAGLDLNHLYSAEFMFYELSVQQQYALAFVLQQMTEYEPAPYPSALRRVANNLVGKATAFVKPKSAEQEKFYGIWNVVQKGVSAYNFAADKEVQLTKTKNADGSEKIHFKSNRIEFERHLAGK